MNKGNQPMAYDYGYNAAINGQGYVRASFLATIDECIAYAMGYCHGAEHRTVLSNA